MFSFSLRVYLTTLAAEHAYNSITSGFVGKTRLPQLVSKALRKDVLEILGSDEVKALEVLDTLLLDEGLAAKLHHGVLDETLYQIAEPHYVSSGIEFAGSSYTITLTRLGKTSRWELIVSKIDDAVSTSRPPLIPRLTMPPSGFYSSGPLPPEELGAPAPVLPARGSLSSVSLNEHSTSASTVEVKPNTTVSTIKGNLSTTGSPLAQAPALQTPTPTQESEPESPPEEMPAVPYDLQHRIVRLLQSLLENAHYEFFQQNLPHILQSKAWHFPEAAELTAYTRELISALSSNLRVLRSPLGTTTQCLKRTDEIRHVAVHRIPVSYAKLEELLETGLKAADLLFAGNSHTSQLIRQLLEPLRSGRKRLQEGIEMARGQRADMERMLNRELEGIEMECNILLRQLEECEERKVRVLDKLQRLDQAYDLQTKDAEVAVMAALRASLLEVSNNLTNRCTV